MSKINVRGVFYSLFLLVILIFGLVIPKGTSAQLSLSSQKSSVGAVGTSITTLRTTVVAPTKLVSPAPTPIISPAPATTHLEGTYEIITQDNFDQKTSTDVPFLQTADGKLIKLDADTSVTSGVSVGTFVSVDGIIPQGITASRTVTVPRGGLRPIRPLISIPSTTTIHKTAIILFNFTDDNSTPSTVDYVRQGVFGPGTSVNGYYDEASFHKVTFQGKLNPAGDVFGWYTIPSSGLDCINSYFNWAPLARVAAQKDGFNIDNYDHVIYAFPHKDCFFAGAAELGGKQSWINGTNFSFGTTFGVIAHELGHNLGLNHSGSLNCLDPVTGKRMVESGNCVFSEEGPGNYFDVMGSGKLFHMNAFQKSVVGFIPPQNIQTVTTDGTYTLMPLEFATKSGAQVLRIPMSSCSFCQNVTGFNTASYYYLEYRRPSTYDNWDSSQFPTFGKGLMINVAPDYTLHGKSILLAPNQDPTILDPDSPDKYILTANQSFQDTVNKIKITTLTAGTASATVKIEFPK